MKINKLFPITTTNLVYHNGKKLSTLLGSKGVNSAILVSYDNSTSNLLAGNVQEAIDEIVLGLLNHILIEKRLFDLLLTKNPNVLYLVYESTELPETPVTPSLGTIEGTILTINNAEVQDSILSIDGNVVDNVLIISSALSDTLEDATVSINTLNLVDNFSISGNILTISGNYNNNIITL